MILPAGAVYIVGGLPQLPNVVRRGLLEALAANHQCASRGVFQFAPAVGDRMRVGQRAALPRYSGASRRQSASACFPRVARTRRSVASRSPRCVNSPSDIECARTQYIAGIEKFTLGHPCEWLDEIENSDGDTLFFYRSRDAIGGDIGARHIGNDRTYIMGGRIRFSALMTRAAAPRSPEKSLICAAIGARAATKRARFGKPYN